MWFHCVATSNVRLFEKRATQNATSAITVARNVSIRFYLAYPQEKEGKELAHAGARSIFRLGFNGTLSANPNLTKCHFRESHVYNMHVKKGLVKIKCRVMSFLANARIHVRLTRENKHPSVASEKSNQRPKQTFNRSLIRKEIINETREWWRQTA